MAKAEYELARLTTKSMAMDSFGFGGIPVDNLEVAGALAFKNPKTGKKLSKKAEALGRFLYTLDDSCKEELARLIKPTLIECKIRPETVYKLCLAAVVNYKHVILKWNRKSLQQDRYELKDAQLAAIVGIAKQNFTDKHRALYEDAYKEIISLDSEINFHIKYTLKESS